MQSTILVILPPWAVFSLFLSLSLQILPMYSYINIDISTNGKQDVLKQPEANTDLLYLLYLSALRYYKSSVEDKLPYIC